MPEKLSSFLKNLLLLIAIVASLFIAIGVFTFFRDSACDRLDAERIAHLEPGHGEHQSASTVGSSSGGASGAGGNGCTPRRKAACTRVSAATSSGSPSPTTDPVSRT